MNHKERSTGAKIALEEIQSYFETEEIILKKDFMKRINHLLEFHSYVITEKNKDNFDDYFIFDNKLRANRNCS